MLRESVGQRDAVAVGELPKLVLVGHRARGRARAEEAAAEARAFLVGPVHEPDRDGRLPSSAIRRSTSTPATTLRQPSSQPPFGTESMWPPMRTARSDSPGSVNHWFPAASIVLDRAGARDAVAEPLSGPFPRLRPRNALRPVLVSGELPELLQLGHGALRVRVATGGA